MTKMKEEADRYADKYREANEVLKLRIEEKATLVQEKQELERNKKELEKQGEELNYERKKWKQK